MEVYADKLGIPLNVGDRVIIASGETQDSSIYLGTVSELSVSRYGSKQVKVKKDGGSINKREPEDVLSLVIYGNNCPEVFI